MDKPKKDITTAFGLVAGAAVAGTIMWVGAQDASIHVEGCPKDKAELATKGTRSMPDWYLSIRNQYVSWKCGLK